MYTAYGGQIHIYATTNVGITTSTPTDSAGTELYNGNATVQEQRTTSLIWMRLPMLRIRVWIVWARR